LEEKIMKKRLSILFGLLIVASMVLTACAPEVQEVIKTVVVTQEVIVEGETVIETVIETVVVTPEPVAEEAKPVTLNYNFAAEPPSLDPSLATDTTSIAVVGNIFVGLTLIDSITNEPLPYLATEWETGTDAEGFQTWTFKLRDDIPWVNFNPATGETTQAVDADGNPRFVNANDVVYGVKRTLTPDTGSDYSYVLYIIKNAQAFNNAEEGVTVDDVGVVALDDYTVQFTLQNPAGYFPSIASMWVAMPMPQWAIEDETYGSKWTEAGLIVTNGPYVVEEWIHGGSLVLVKNPLWINAADVQIERIEGLMIIEESTEFALYENNELDTSAVPLPEMDRVKTDPVLSAEYYQAPQACTYYYGFTNTKPPFDDVRVRRAFSQAIDRQSLIDNVLKGGQIPATSFAPPGIFGAPPPGEVGLGTDPAAAKAALDEYLAEKGMTLDDFNAMGITLMHNTSEAHARIAAAVQQMWKDTLGVDVQVENQEWGVYLDTVDNQTPIADMPHIWRLGWCADYPDENNWVHEVFNATAGDNNLRRNCSDAVCTETTNSEFDELTYQAQAESDPAVRAELYREAERILAEEETAYAPMYHYTFNRVTKPWLIRNYPSVAPLDFFNWKIDWEAKLAATGQ
jgi:oligopeptide transport system substrate-binding protein